MGAVNDAIDLMGLMGFGAGAACIAVSVFKRSPMAFRTMVFKQIERAGLK